MIRRGAAFLLALMSLPALAQAGAWPVPAGETQAILKYEGSEATSGFDPSGNLLPIGKQRDESLSLFVEHGLTSRLTLQLKARHRGQRFVHPLLRPGSSRDRPPLRRL